MGSETIPSSTGELNVAFQRSFKSPNMEYPNFPGYTSDLSTALDQMLRCSLY